MRVLVGSPVCKGWQPKLSRCCATSDRIASLEGQASMYAHIEGLWIMKSLLLVHQTVEWSIMALTNDLEAGNLAETLSLSQPRRTYNANNDRSDSAAPAIPLQELPNMGSSEIRIRNRLPQPQLSNNVDQSGERSVSSGVETIPTSSQNFGERQGMQVKTSSKKL